MTPTSPFPYCGAPALPDDLALRWNLDPALIAAIALAMALHWRLAGTERRLGLFLAGWGLVGLVFISPLCALASALFAARTAHHTLLIAVIPPLLLSASPRLFAGSRSGGALLPAALAHALILWGWHAPPAYAAALADVRVYWLMQASLFGSAFLVWRGAFAVQPSFAAAGAMAVTFMQTALLGAALALAPQPLYAFHFTTTAAWGLTALSDQQLAGTLMWTLGGVPYLWAALALALQLAGSEPRAA
jgi:putative membrane protein